MSYCKYFVEIQFYVKNNKKKSIETNKTVVLQN